LGSQRIVRVLCLRLLGWRVLLSVRVGRSDRSGCRSVKADQVLDDCRSGSWTTVHLLHTGQLCRGNGLSFLWRKIGVLVVTAVAVSPGHLSLALDRTNNHLWRPELENLWHDKVGNPVESQIEGFNVRNVTVGRLGDEMRPKGTRQTGHTELEVVLKDLIGGPPVLPGFGIVNVLSIAHYRALSAVERPSEDDFVLAPTAVGSGLSARNGRGIPDSKLEGDLLFGKAKGFRRVFDTVVNLVGAENFRHDC